ncbi:probable LRR receptor-like serine/threonine-protein kinase At3g47570 [Salvia miltiorrhiza]|uniref:probable LRR receptor-like serine/threonine-protein kinase At3g47570 n=1 Tax=Salvia miltiorrhiza TaxID=226208 RepID=UPI0025AD9B15|nr:probable LRR receptor-like serine/threonine-protein kinase At3g47570 [Salvia miltiorrhiza]
MRLSYADLLNATAGFSEQNLLGAGRFGSVYKGILGVEHDQTPVAVKVLHLLVKGASKSFAAECDALRGARHRNLLKILSVCESIDFQGNDFKALVYEFKSNGSLEQWLHRCDGGSKLSVMQRLNIAVDIAQAIKYLHLGTDSVIIHGDLKPSNILLDEDMSACVGDFGLAKIVSNMVLSHDSSSSSTMIRGTIGYVPPEYGMSNSISTQGDVYSFGIVLLEMFVNKKPTDDLFQDGSNLHDFVAASLPDRVMEIVDPSLFPAGFEITNEQMNYVASILTVGLSCSKEMPKDRTSIVDVVNELSMIHKLFSTRRR